MQGYSNSLYRIHVVFNSTHIYVSTNNIFRHNNNINIDLFAIPYSKNESILDSEIKLNKTKLEQKNVQMQMFVKLLAK